MVMPVAMATPSLVQEQCQCLLGPGYWTREGGGGGGSRRLDEYKREVWRRSEKGHGEVYKRIEKGQREVMGKCCGG